VREAYDVVVVGGGIHGVGVAQAAAAARHTVLLLEREALAAGTSSRSSKLVHGGIRYLERGRLGLVAECLRERRLLARLAPQLVRLRWFHVPVYRMTRRRPWQLRLGLSLYAALGRLAPECRFETLPRRAWADLDGLVTEGLKTVFRYRDAQADDAVLTRAVMGSARALGAELVMPARFERARLEADGCRVEFTCEGGEQGECRAAVLVNAAGPWAAGVLERIDPPPFARRVELVQGAHILVRGQISRGVYYVEAPADGRAVLVMPWNGDTLVGTTETAFRGDPGEARITPEERSYLAATLEHYFPRFGASGPGAIKDAFAGLRVLPAGNGSAFHRSREAYLDVDRARRPRVLTIWGGKLTTYRSTAERVMRRIAASLPARAPRADTRQLPLAGDEGDGDGR
jgi:glycerol-3-phosphate dehydrogenase